MTERFVLEDEVIIDNNSIADDEGRQLYWTVEYAQRQKLVKLMNELAEENEQLNSEVKRLSHEQMCDAHLIQQLRNSLYIDPYKEFIKYRNKFIGACEELAEVNKEYGKLVEENEQLKLEIQKLKNNTK